MRSLVFALALLAAAPALRAQSLFADPKAARAGDALTVVLAERANAQRNSQYADKSDAKVSAAARTGAGTFGADAAFGQDASARNETAQSDLLTGTMTVLVTGVDAGGNLTVEGTRLLNVNGVTHVMKVAGLVRPRDIRYDNTILSYQIANARVEYRQDGKMAKIFKPGMLARIGALAALAAAAFFAAN